MGINLNPSATALLIILALLALSCAYYPDISYTVAKYQLRDKPICCNSLKELTYQQLSVGDAIKFLLTRESNAYNFETGKSFFSAFRLPDSDTQLRIMLYSYYGPDVVLYPTVTVLNSKYEITRIIDSARSFGLRMRYITFVVNADEDEKYIIVHTSSDRVGFSERHVDEGDYWTYTYSPVGSLKIFLKR